MMVNPYPESKEYLFSKPFNIRILLYCMLAGKIPSRTLKKIVYSMLGASSQKIVVGPKIGEDTAVIKAGNRYLIVASDPVTGATKNIGAHVVHVNSNDVAATGADPEFFMPTILLKEGCKEEELREITSQMDKTCKDIGVSIIGGHTEVTPGLKNNIISGTMLGYTTNYIATSGAKENDVIILTKGAGIEGTSILANEMEDKLKESLNKKTIERAKTYAKRISILKEARIARKYATSMHDPTEGGIAGALNELADACGLGFDTDIDKIHIPNETREICNFFSCDPLNLIGSGALLITVYKDDSNTLVEELKKEGIGAAIIGKITKKGRNISPPKQDALWKILKR
ncbi:MAG: AIR synthase family protein [Candidatus Methanofastidiosia archaeon]